jgi:hypothetical protein
MKALGMFLGLVVICTGTPAWAEPPGVMTVAQFRQFLTMMEEEYDARASGAVASFYSAGAATKTYLWGDCLRGQSVGELSAWLRTTAPPDLTLLQALRLNAKERGCEPRELADTDAELAIRSGPKH